MADGAYRWQGHAPAPDAARIDAIDAGYDEAGADAFAEPARAAAVDRIERALAAARTGDLTEAAAQLTHARSVLEGLNPAALEPRRGLAGLFDSRGRRLKAFRQVYEKEIEGFGELFRQISFEKVKTSTIQSRATGGVAKGTYLFALPGSPGACRDGWEEILRWQLDSRHRPCNLVELMPRLQEHLKPVA